MITRGAFPPVLNGNGSGCGGEVSGGGERSGCGEGELSGGVGDNISVDREGGKSRRPPIFEGVGVTIGCLEDVRAVPRSEGLGAERWCCGGRGAGVGLKDGAEIRSREIEGTAGK